MGKKTLLKEHKENLKNMMLDCSVELDQLNRQSNKIKKLFSKIQILKHQIKLAEEESRDKFDSSQYKLYKFWLWMEDKKYYHNGHTYSESLCDKEFFKNHKQMFIGYKIEFITDLIGKFVIGTVSSIDELDKELDELIEQFTDER